MPRLDAPDRLRLAGTDALSWTPSEVIAALLAAGASEVEARRLYGIGTFESGFQVGMINRNRNGSVDRGPWQINDRAWPDITDQQAHTLDTAAVSAVRILRTQGPTAWVVWDTKRAAVDSAARAAPIPGTGPTNDGRVPPRLPPPGGGGGGTWAPAGPGAADVYRTGAAVVADRLPGPLGDVVRGGASVGGAVIENASKAAGGIGDLLSPLQTIADVIGKAGSVLTSAEFWRRTGAVLLGVAVAIIGLALIVRKPATQAAATVAALKTGGLTA